MNEDSPEQWRAIVGYEGLYEVSDRGSGKVKGHSIHRLVASAFLGVPADAHLLHVCHYDGDRQHNHLSNLRWDTVAANYEDNVHDGRRRCRECARIRSRVG